MSKTFWIFLVVGLIAVAIAVSMTWDASKGGHLQLDGQIRHVRTFAASPKATIMIVDIHENNPSDIGFKIKDVQMTLDGVSGDATGKLISKFDLNNIFAAMKEIGPKFNEAFGMGDVIQPRSSSDMMIGARFELSEAEVKSRKAVRVTLEEMNRTMAELVEKR